MPLRPASASRASCFKRVSSFFFFQVFFALCHFVPFSYLFPPRFFLFPFAVVFLLQGFAGFLLFAGLFAVCFLFSGFLQRLFGDGDRWPPDVTNFVFWMIFLRFFKEPSRVFYGFLVGFARFFG